MYRQIDFKRRKDGVPGKIASIEYDPNRTTRIALVHYVDGEKSYILAPLGLSTGDMVESGPQAEIQPGNCLPLQNIPTGTVVHNIEMTPNRGGQIVRSAGVGAQVLSREGAHVLIRLPSGEMRRFLLVCRASVGQLSNPDHKNESLGKSRREPPQGSPTPCQGCSDEPCRPPPRRRRRPVAHRNAGTQVTNRQADSGAQDPSKEQGLQQPDRTPRKEKVDCPGPSRKVHTFIPS